MICLLAETGGLGGGRVGMKEDVKVFEDVEMFRGAAGTCCPSLDGEICRESGGDARGEGCGGRAVGCVNSERRNAFRARTWRFASSSEAPPALIGLEKFKCLRWVEGVRPTERGSVIGLDSTSPLLWPWSSTTPSCSSDDTTTVGRGTELVDRDPWYKLCGYTLPPVGCADAVLRF